MEQCNKLENCGFFKKYENSTQIDCRGFIDAYCKGPKMKECARLEFYRKHNRSPVDEMMPSGKIIDTELSFNPYSNNVENYY